MEVAKHPTQRDSDKISTSALVNTRRSSSGSSSAISMVANSSSNSTNDIIEGFRKQALTFYKDRSPENQEKLLSPEIEKCLAKRADAYVKGENRCLFVFPCENDLSNINDDELEVESPLLKLKASNSSGSMSQTEIPICCLRHLSSILASNIQTHENLCDKNKDIDE